MVDDWKHRFQFLYFDPALILPVHCIHTFVFLIHCLMSRMTSISSSFPLESSGVVVSASSRWSGQHTWIPCKIFVPHWLAFRRARLSGVSGVLSSKPNKLSHCRKSIQIPLCRPAVKHLGLSATCLMEKK